MPMLRVYVNEETYAGLKRIAADRQRAEKPEDLAESAVANAVLEYPWPAALAPELHSDGAPQLTAEPDAAI